MIRKGYAIVRITIQREIKVSLDDEHIRNDQEIVEEVVSAKYGELNKDIDEPEEVEILFIDYDEE